MGKGAEWMMDSGKAASTAGYGILVELTFALACRYEVEPRVIFDAIRSSEDSPIKTDMLKLLDQTFAMVRQEIK